MPITCHTCRHRIKMSSGKRFAQYCDIFRSTRTVSGHLRVKCNQPSCERYVQGSAQDATVPANQLSLFDQ